MSADFVIVMYKDRPELAENLAEYESDSYPKVLLRKTRFGRKSRQLSIRNLPISSFSL